MRGGAARMEDRDDLRWRSGEIEGEIARGWPASRKTLTASGVHGMFAPSATATTPPATSALAAKPPSSF